MDKDKATIKQKERDKGKITTNKENNNKKRARNLKQ